jgi:hypothetical protein
MDQGTFAGLFQIWVLFVWSQDQGTNAEIIA